MDEIEFIPIQEALDAKRAVKKSKVVQEVEAKLKKLPAGQSGRIVAKSEKPQTIKNRITRVAKNLGMSDIVVKRAGNEVFFFRAPKKKE